MEDRHEVLSVRDLEIGYSTSRGLVRAVRGVSFELGDDESLAFIGESGSGKTTLGLALLRLVTSQGRIEFGGRELQGLRSSALRPRLSPPSSALSMRTSNHDSMLLPRNWTDTP